MPEISMSEIEKYDRAVYSYLTSISSKIIYSPTQYALRNITKREEFNDKKPWNFISYYRSSLFDIDWDSMNNYATVTGDFTNLYSIREEGVEEVSVGATYVQNIPVTLSYNVELWASKAVEVQQMAISLISKLFMRDQVLEVPINPEGETGRFHIDDISWHDNSDIEREMEIGKIYRHTISFSIVARITLVKEIDTVRFCDIPINIYE